MEEEESVVEINLCDSSTCLTVSRHVRQFVVLTKSLTASSSTYTTSDVVFLRDDVVPNAVDSLDVSLVACEGSNVCHTSIHISCSHCMTHCFILLQHWQVALAVFSLDCGISTFVEEEFGKVQIFLVASSDIEFCQTHLCNLVSRNDTCLTRFVTHLFINTVGELDSDVQ